MKRIIQLCVMIAIFGISNTLSADVTLIEELKARILHLETENNRKQDELIERYEKEIKLHQEAQKDHDTIAALNRQLNERQTREGKEAEAKLDDILNDVYGLTAAYINFEGEKTEENESSPTPPSLPQIAPLTPPTEPSSILSTETLTQTPTLSAQQKQLYTQWKSGQIGPQAWAYLGGPNKSLAQKLCEAIVDVQRYEVLNGVDIFCLEPKYFTLSVNGKRQKKSYKFG